MSDRATTLWTDIGHMLDAWFDANMGSWEAMLAAERLAARLRFREDLIDLLSRVYRPQGVEVWLTGRNSEWGGLTVDQMYEAGRGDEVLATAERLAEVMSS